MADNEKNKMNLASTWGDTDSIGLQVENDNKQDYMHDSVIVPEPPAANNKFDGVADVDRGEKMNLDMALEPNKFPREKGHDSLSGEEAVLS